MTTMFIYQHRLIAEPEKMRPTIHECHMRKSFRQQSLLVAEILPYLEDMSHHYNLYFGTGDKSQSMFVVFAVLLMYFSFVAR